MNSSTFPKDQDGSDKQDTLIQKIQMKRKGDFNEKKSKRICRKAPRRGLDDSCLKETEYYFDNYLRKVYPYFFTYTTFCKGRWVGKKLIDVFGEEFRAHSKEEYEKNIAAGNIRVNNEVINADYVFKENDQVSNLTHRHEIAVAAAPIRIIHSDSSFVVVDKPPSVPVHPCGRYRHNCLLFILAKEHNFKELYSVHRLDRLTSGLLLFTKTIRKSQEVNEQIRERKIKKEYVCRVVGEFPDEVIYCREPIEILSPKMGICIVSQTGKDCETEFEKVSYNGRSSVVRCKPLTGRMHQIRVHLQYLGYPIINDPIYNHDHVFGPMKGKNGETGKSRDQLLEDLLQTHNLKKWLIDDDSGQDNPSSEAHSEEDSEENKMSLHALEYYLKSDGFKKLSEEYVKKPEKFEVGIACDLCTQKYMDPQPKDLIMFLHALKYEGLGWKFESELPEWATADWSESSS